MNFKVKVENKSKNDIFLLSLTYASDKETSFRFSNNNHLLERRDLIIWDNDIVLHPDTIIHIKPREINKIETTISDKNPFIYEIKGKLIEEGEKVRLKLPSVEYLLEKEKQYGIELRYGDDISNREIFEL